MRNININPKRLIAATATMLVAGGLLAACGSFNDDPPVTELTVESIKEMACEKVADYSDFVTEHSTANSINKQVKLNKYGIEETDKDQIKTVLTALDDRAKTCSDGNDTEQVSDSETTPADDVCVVEESDGTTREMPGVGGCSPDAAALPISGTDSDNDVRTPPVVGETAELTSWCDFTERYAGSDWDWYRAGVERTAKITWEDAQSYCEIEEEQNIEARVIFVSNSTISDAEARTMVAADGTRNAERLSVSRQGSFINTRGLARQQMNEFVDNRTLVRVDLVPFITDENGKAIEYDLTRGVFTGCKNAHRTVRVSYPPGQPPTAPPSSTPPPTNPPTSPPTTPPVDDDKVIADHPVNNGNAPRDTWAPAPAPTAAPSAPGGGAPPPNYSAPAPPPATPAPTLTQPPAPAPSDPPPVVVDPEPSHTTAPPPTW